MFLPIPILCFSRSHNIYSFKYENLGLLMKLISLKHFTSLFSLAPSLLNIMASGDRLSRLPAWSSHWLGYRSSPPRTQPIYIVYLWPFVGAFVGMSILQAVFEQNSYFTKRHVPPIIASYVRYQIDSLFLLLSSILISQTNREPPPSSAMATSILLSPSLELSLAATSSARLQASASPNSSAYSLRNSDSILFAGSLARCPPPSQYH